jgi:hypothetical protein
VSNAANVPPNGREGSILALIVQRSTIELFAAYGVAVAPVRSIPVSAERPFARPPEHLVGMVEVAAPDRRGVLTISTSPATLARMRPIASDPRAQLDWMRELTNQLAGRIKSKFARYQLVLQMSLPSALSSSAMDRNQFMRVRAADLVFVFHTLRDEILLTLSGGFDGTGLSLQSDAPVADEGDVILF